MGSNETISTQVNEYWQSGQLPYTLLSLCFMLCWFIYLTFWNARVVGLFLTFIIRRFTKYNIKIGSFSLSVLGGKLMLRDVYMINEDYSFRSYYLVIVFNYWKLYDPNNKDESDRSLKIHAFKPEFHMFNRSEVYKDLKNVMYNISETSRLLTMENIRNYASQKNNINKQKSSPADYVDSRYSQDTSETKTSSWEFNYQALFPKIIFDLKLFTLCFGNHLLPTTFRVKCDKSFITYCTKSASYEIDKYQHNLEAKCTNFMVGFVETLNYKGANNFHSLGSKEIVRLGQAEFLFQLDEPGLTTLEPEMLQMSNRNIEVIRTYPKYYLKVKVKRDCKISYNSWLDSQRDVLYKFFFPPDFQTMKVSPIPQSGTKRLHKGFDILFVSESDTTLELDFVGKKFEWLSKQESSLSIHMPWLIEENGYTTTVKTNIPESLWRLTHECCTELLRAEQIQLTVSMYYPRVWNARQVWSIDLNVSQAQCYLLFDFKNFFADLINDWANDSYPDLCKFVPFVYDVNITTIDTKFILFCNEYNWIADNDENAYIALSPAKTEMHFILPFIDFLPDTVPYKINLKAEDVKGQLSLPETNTSLYIIKELHRQMKIVGNDCKPINNSDLFTITTDFAKGEENKKPSKRRLVHWIDCMYAPIVTADITYNYHPMHIVRDYWDFVGEDLRRKNQELRHPSVVNIDDPLSALRPEGHVTNTGPTAIFLTSNHFDGNQCMDPDVVELDVKVEGGVACLYGSLLRQILHLKENYFGEDQTPTSFNAKQQTAEERAREIDDKINSDKVTDPRDYRPFSAIIKVQAHNVQGHLMKHCSNDATPCPTVFIDCIAFEMDKGPLRTMLQVVVSPILVMVFDSGQDRSQPETSLNRGSVVIESLQVRGHALFSNNSLTEYGWLLEACIGRIRGQMTAPQLNTLVHAIQCFVFLVLDQENEIMPSRSFEYCQHLWPTSECPEWKSSKTRCSPGSKRLTPAHKKSNQRTRITSNNQLLIGNSNNCPREVDVKYKMLRIVLDGLSVNFVEESTCLQLSVIGPVHLVNCNLHGETTREGISALLPDVSVGQFIKPKYRFKGTGGNSNNNFMKRQSSRSSNSTSSARIGDEYNYLGKGDIDDTSWLESGSLSLGEVVLNAGIALPNPQARARQDKFLRYHDNSTKRLWFLWTDLHVDDDENTVKANPAKVHEQILKQKLSYQCGCLGGCEFFGENYLNNTFSRTVHDTNDEYYDRCDVFDDDDDDDGDGHCRAVKFVPKKLLGRTRLFTFGESIFQKGKWIHDTHGKDVCCEVLSGWVQLRNEKEKDQTIADFQRKKNYPFYSSSCSSLNRNNHQENDEDKLLTPEDEIPILSKSNTQSEIMSSSGLASGGHMLDLDNIVKPTVTSSLSNTENDLDASKLRRKYSLKSLISINSSSISTSIDLESSSSAGAHKDFTKTTRQQQPDQTFNDSLHTSRKEPPTTIGDGSNKLDYSLNEEDSSSNERGSKYVDLRGQLNKNITESNLLWSAYERHLTRYRCTNWARSVYNRYFWLHHYPNRQMAEFQCIQDGFNPKLIVHKKFSQQHTSHQHPHSHHHHQPARNTRHKLSRADFLDTGFVGIHAMTHLTNNSAASTPCGGPPAINRRGKHDTISQKFTVSTSNINERGHPNESIKDNQRHQRSYDNRSTHYRYTGHRPLNVTNDVSNSVDEKITDQEPHNRSADNYTEDSSSSSSSTTIHDTTAKTTISLKFNRAIDVLLTPLFLECMSRYVAVLTPELGRSFTSTVINRLHFQSVQLTLDRLKPTKGFFSNSPEDSEEENGTLDNSTSEHPVTTNTHPPTSSTTPAPLTTITPSQQDPSVSQLDGIQHSYLHSMSTATSNSLTQWVHRKMNSVLSNTAGNAATIGSTNSAGCVISNTPPNSSATLPVTTVQWANESDEEQQPDVSNQTTPKLRPKVPTRPISASSSNKQSSTVINMDKTSELDQSDGALTPTQYHDSKETFDQTDKPTKSSFTQSQGSQLRQKEFANVSVGLPESLLIGGSIANDDIDSNFTGSLVAATAGTPTVMPKFPDDVSSVNYGDNNTIRNAPSRTSSMDETTNCASPTVIATSRISRTQLSVGIDRINVCIMQLYAVEDVVNTDTLVSGLHDLTCVSLMSLCLDTACFQILVNTRNEGLTELELDPSKQGKHRRQSSIPKLERTNTTTGTNAGDMTNFLKTEDMVANIEVKRIHGQLRRLTRDSQFSSTVMLTAIPFNSSKVFFAFDSDPGGALQDDVKFDERSAGWIMFECGLENLTLKGIRKRGFTDNMDDYSKKSKGQNPAETASLHEDEEEVSQGEKELSSSEGDLSRNALLTLMTLKTVWLNFPAPKKLPNKRRINITRDDWNLLSTATPMIRAWMDPADRLWRVCHKLKQTIERRQLAVLACLMTEISFSKFTNKLLINNDKNYYDKWRTKLSRNIYIEPTCQAFTVMRMYLQEMPNRVLEIERSTKEETLPQIDILQRGIFALTRHFQHVVMIVDNTPHVWIPQQQQHQPQNYNYNMQPVRKRNQSVSLAPSTPVNTPINDQFYPTTTSAQRSTPNIKINQNINASEDVPFYEPNQVTELEEMVIHQSQSPENSPNIGFPIQHKINNNSSSKLLNDENPLNNTNNNSVDLNTDPTTNLIGADSQIMERFLQDANMSCAAVISSSQQNQSRQDSQYGGLRSSKGMDGSNDKRQHTMKRPISNEGVFTEDLDNFMENNPSFVTTQFNHANFMRMHYRYMEDAKRNFKPLLEIVGLHIKGIRRTTLMKKFGGFLSATGVLETFKIDIMQSESNPLSQYNKQLSGPSNGTGMDLGNEVVVIRDHFNTSNKGKDILTSLPRPEHINLSHAKRSQHIPTNKMSSIPGSVYKSSSTFRCQSFSTKIIMRDIIGFESCLKSDESSENLEADLVDIKPTTTQVYVTVNINEIRQHVNMPLLRLVHQFVTMVYAAHDTREDIDNRRVNEWSLYSKRHKKHHSKGSSNDTVITGETTGSSSFGANRSSQHETLIHYSTLRSTSTHHRVPSGGEDLQNPSPNTNTTDTTPECWKQMYMILDFNSRVPEMKTIPTKCSHPHNSGHVIDHTSALINNATRKFSIYNSAFVQKLQSQQQQQTPPQPQQSATVIKMPTIKEETSTIYEGVTNTPGGADRNMSQINIDSAFHNLLIEENLSSNETPEALRINLGNNLPTTEQLNEYQRKQKKNLKPSQRTSGTVAMEKFTFPWMRSERIPLLVLCTGKVRKMCLTAVLSELNLDGKLMNLHSSFTHTSRVKGRGIFQDKSTQQSLSVHSGLLTTTLFEQLIEPNNIQSRRINVVEIIGKPSHLLFTANKMKKIDKNSCFFSLGVIEFSLPHNPMKLKDVMQRNAKRISSTVTEILRPYHHNLQQFYENTASTTSTTGINMDRYSDTNVVIPSATTASNSFEDTGLLSMKDDKDLITPVTATTPGSSFPIFAPSATNTQGTNIKDEVDGITSSNNPNNITNYRPTISTKHKQAPTKPSYLVISGLTKGLTLSVTMYQNTIAKYALLPVYMSGKVMDDDFKIYISLKDHRLSFEVDQRIMGTADLPKAVTIKLPKIVTQVSKKTGTGGKFLLNQGRITQDLVTEKGSYIDVLANISTLEHQVSLEKLSYILVTVEYFIKEIDEVIQKIASNNNGNNCGGNNEDIGGATGTNKEKGEIDMNLKEDNLPGYMATSADNKLWNRAARGSTKFSFRVTMDGIKLTTDTEKFGDIRFETRQIDIELTNRVRSTTITKKSLDNVESVDILESSSATVTGVNMRPKDQISTNRSKYKFKTVKIPGTNFNKRISPNDRNEPASSNTNSNNIEIDTDPSTVNPSVTCATDECQVDDRETIFVFILFRTISAELGDTFSDDLYIERPPEFRSLAKFDTRISLRSLLTEEMRARRLIKPEQQRDDFLIQLQRPRLWARPVAISRAISIFRLFNSRLERYRLMLGPSSQCTSVPTPHNLINTNKATCPIQKIVFVQLVMEDFGVSIPLSVPFPSTNANGVPEYHFFDSYTPDPRSHLVITLEHARLSCCFKNNIACQGEFNNFCTRFDENFNIGSDDWKPINSSHTHTADTSASSGTTNNQNQSHNNRLIVFNGCVVPKGTYILRSTVMDAPQHQNTSTKTAHLVLDWSMCGLETHLDWFIGKRLKELTGVISRMIDIEASANTSAVDAPQANDESSHIHDDDKDRHPVFFVDSPEKVTAKKKSSARKSSSFKKLKLPELTTKGSKTSPTPRKSTLISKKTNEEKFSDISSNSGGYQTPENMLNHPDFDSGDQPGDLSRSSTALSESTYFEDANEFQESDDDENFEDCLEEGGRKVFTPTPKIPVTLPAPKPRPSESSNTTSMSIQPALHIDLKVNIKVDSGNCVLHPRISTQTKPQTNKNYSFEEDSHHHHQNITQNVTMMAIDNDEDRFIELRKRYNNFQAYQHVYTPISIFNIPAVDVSICYTNKPSNTVKNKADLYALVLLKKLPKDLEVYPSLLDFVEQAIDMGNELDNKDDDDNDVDDNESSSSNQSNNLTKNKSKTASSDSSATIFPITHSLPVDVIVHVKVKPSTLRISSQPQSPIQCRLALPFVDLVFTTKRGSIEPIIKHHVVDKSDDNSITRTTEGGLSVTGVLRDFSMMVYHPYSGSNRFDTYNASGSASNSSRGANANDPNANINSSLVLIVEKVHVNLCRMHRMNITNIICSPMGRGMTMDSTIYPATNNSNSQFSVTQYRHEVRVSAVAEIGCARFKLDVRKLHEIFSFCSTWYRGSLARKLFLGADATTTANADPNEFVNDFMERGDSSDSDNNIADNYDMEFGERKRTDTNQTLPHLTTASTSKSNSMSSSWRSTTMWAVSSEELSVEMGMGSSMGRAILELGSAWSRGHVTLDTGGGSGSSTSAGREVIRWQMGLGRAKLEAKDGIVGGEASVSGVDGDMVWISGPAAAAAAAAVTSLNSSMTNSVSNQNPEGARLYIKLDHLEALLLYMQTIVALTRVNMLSVEWRDSNSNVEDASSDKSYQEDHQERPINQSKYVEVGGKLQWDQAHLAIGRNTVSDLGKMCGKVQDYVQSIFRESRQSALGAAMLSNNTFDEIRFTFSGKRSTESRPNRNREDDDSSERYWNKVLKRHWPTVFREYSPLVNLTRSGGSLELCGASVAVACFSGNLKTSLDWAVFSLNYPEVIFETQADLIVPQSIEDGQEAKVVVKQLLKITLGGTVYHPITFVVKVVTNREPQPKSVPKIDDWFEYALYPADVVIRQHIGNTGAGSSPMSQPTSPPPPPPQPQQTHHSSAAVQSPNNSNVDLDQSIYNTNTIGPNSPSSNLVTHMSNTGSANTSMINTNTDSPNAPSTPQQPQLSQSYASPDIGGYSSSSRWFDKIGVFSSRNRRRAGQYTAMSTPMRHSVRDNPIKLSSATGDICVVLPATNFVLETDHEQLLRTPRVSDFGRGNEGPPDVHVNASLAANFDGHLTLGISDVMWLPNIFKAYIQESTYESNKTPGNSASKSGTSSGDDNNNLDKSSKKDNNSTNTPSSKISASLTESLNDNSNQASSNTFPTIDEVDNRGGGSGITMDSLNSAKTSLPQVEDMRQYITMSFNMNPKIRMLQANQLSVPAFDHLLKRIGLIKAKSTIPKWLQRILLDNLDEFLAESVMKVLHLHQQKQNRKITKDK